MPDDTTLPDEPRARVRLLPPCGEHVGFVARLYRDARTMRHLGGPRDERDAAALARTMLSGTGAAGQGQHLWIIQDPDTGSPAGLAGLTPKGAATLELGLLLAGEHQGRGLGRAAVLALRARAAGLVPGARLVARHAPGNEGMARLLAGLGFERIEADADGYLAWRDPGVVRTQDAGPVAIG